MRALLNTSICLEGVGVASQKAGDYGQENAMERQSNLFSIRNPIRSLALRTLSDIVYQWYFF